MKRKWTRPTLVSIPNLARPIETVFIVNSGDNNWKPEDRPPWTRIDVFTRCKEFLLGRRPHSV